MVQLARAPAGWTMDCRDKPGNDTGESGEPHSYLSYQKRSGR